MLLAESYLCVENVPLIIDSSLHRVTMTSLILNEGDDCTQRTEPMVLGVSLGCRFLKSLNIYPALFSLIGTALRHEPCYPRRKLLTLEACSLCMPAHTCVCVCVCECE